MTPAPDSKDEAAYLALRLKTKSLLDIMLENAYKAVELISGVGSK